MRLLYHFCVLKSRPCERSQGQGFKIYHSTVMQIRALRNPDAYFRNPD